MAIPIVRQNPAPYTFYPLPSCFCSLFGLTHSLERSEDKHQLNIHTGLSLSAAGVTMYDQGILPFKLLKTLITCLQHLYLQKYNKQV